VKSKNFLRPFFTLHFLLLLPQMSVNKKVGESGRKWEKVCIFGPNNQR